MPASGSELSDLQSPPASQEWGAEPPPHGELQYLGQIEHILRCGFRKGDRTGTGTLSVFGMQARYSLRDEFPLLTTKRVFWKAVLEELLWFIKVKKGGERIGTKPRLCGTIALFVTITPGDFVHTLGDAHIYLNHIEPLKMQLQRKPKPFPKLKILRKVETIDDFKAEDFQIEGYSPHPTIKMEMAI
ncbi:PREDICTED: thymidylate synthase [Hipposideros armiger]|uniref:Thymidylate synthase n=1 Tax=Hipposideros armiger TaxID=186990 RepID=A0A8B7Q5A5_HIPAR|nr:PREDICTED: thymidylate synthase [Hipposideros armiger]